MTDAGKLTGSPAAGPGTSNQMIFAICQPIAITSSRLTHGGKRRLIADSMEVPSTFEKSAQLALLVMLSSTGIRGFGDI